MMVIIIYVKLVAKIAIKNIIYKTKMKLLNIRKNIVKKTKIKLLSIRKNTMI